MNKKILMMATIIVTASWGAFIAGKDLNLNRRSLVEHRDAAITKAMDEGVYNCCVDPPCTMCFWEANEWNNFTAGTCACDELIAQGKEPCPQCHNQGCGSEKGTCPIKND